MSRTHSLPRTRTRELHPRLEPLERRCLLTTFQWAGGASGDFSAAANWKDPNGNPGVPGPNDAITVAVAGGATVNVTGSATVNSVSMDRFETLNVTGGTFTVADGNSASSQVGTLNVSAGAAFHVGAGTVSLVAAGTVAGTLDVASGATLGFYGDGPFNFNAGAAFAGAGRYDINGYFTTLNININTNLTAPQDVTFEEGTLQGSGTLTVTGTFTGCNRARAKDSAGFLAFSPLEPR